MNDYIDQLLDEAMKHMDMVEIKGEMNMNNQLVAFIKIREARKMLKEAKTNEKRNDA